VYIDEAARRRGQVEEAMRIGDGCDQIRLAGSIELDEMLERFVYIEDGQQVVDLKQPQHPKLLADFKSAMKSSKTTVEVKGEFNRDGTPKTKSCETTKLWEQSPGRQIAQAVTFKAGGLRVVPDPKGREAINTWNLPKRSTLGGDASLFLEHVDYLFGEDSGLFLNWLAHIEQKPGELPQTGWLHISERQGTGRNWLASVLARLWPGYAAVNFDLAGCLRTGFNDRLSSKLIAIVDEINEGANESKWRNAETLKSLLNESQRTINPKFGRIREEYNACRFLVFSNHLSALALSETDRRFNVVLNENPPLASEYYTRLYAALKNPEFIAGVAKLLNSRDLSEFNLGAHAVMNAAKEAVIAANRSEADEILVDVVTRWPSDLIKSSIIGELITGNTGGQLTKAHQHALTRRSVRAYGALVKLEGRPTRICILRNHDRWKNAAACRIREELARVPAASVVTIGGARAFLDNLMAED